MNIYEKTLSGLAERNRMKMLKKNNRISFPVFRWAKMCVGAIHTRLRLFLIAVLFFSPAIWSGGAFGQTYPVQISTQLIPPYSGYLTDYADPSSEKLKVILQFNDFSVPQYNLRLKFEIKGNGFTLSTKTFYLPAPISLLPGQPLLLSSADLAPYLNSNNMDFIGINQAQYEQRMALPEGYYSICVKAYDYYNNTNIQVSNEACAQAWFTFSDPPFLNLPFCNSVVTPQTPQNILFQWTPLNQGSPNSALNTEYEFALWEMRPDSNANPNQIVLSTTPIYSTTTQQTFLNYGITETPLNLYMKYVWRVRVKDVTGRDWFKNEGKSQICTFTYGNASSVLGDVLKLTLNAQPINHRAGQCDWTTQSAFKTYLLQVRKQGTNYWFDYPNTTGIERVGNLEPTTTYECRVRGEAPGIIGDWSNSALFTTQGPPVYNCNDPAMPYNTAPNAPLPFEKATRGLVFQSGQFEVTTTQIESTGAPGWFKGRGSVRFFLKKIPVKWDNIYIDIDSRQQQGVIEAVTKGIDKWLHDWDVHVAEENATYVNGKVDSVFVAGNQVCYITQGNLICVPTPTNTNLMVIRDGEGNQYSIQFIPPPAKVTGPANYLEYSNDSLLASDNKMVNFEMSPDQIYGFDKKQYAAFIKDYEVIKLGSGKNYFVSNKSIGEGQSDEVKAIVTIVNFNPALLIFKTASGTLLTTVPGNVPEIIRVTGIPDNANCIYAWYDNKKIGKLNIIRLKILAKKLIFVPVNNAAVPQTVGLAGIYRQANITWSVSTAANFTFNLGNDGLELADANILSKYSPEMRALRDAYQKFDSLYDKNAYYLFVVPNFSNPDLKGYMVRGRAVGFISTNATVKEISHELAHGAFGLEHTFPEIEKASSNNLLDYTEGTQLVKKQWMMMQYGKFDMNWFDEEEDAAYYYLLTKKNTAGNVFYWINKLKVAYKNNTKVTIPETTTLIGKAPKCFLGGIEFPFVNLYVKNVGPGQEADVKNKVTIGPALVETDGVELVQTCVLIDNGKFILHTIPGLLNALKVYIEANTFKNLILFVNGYRPVLNRNGDPITNSAAEYDDSNNEVECGDSRGYWKGIDAQFMNRIGTRNAVYADGHHSVGTSNHLSVGKYTMANIASVYFKAKCENDPVMALGYKDYKGYLHTVPNYGGFTKRASSGELAGQQLVQKINSGVIVFNKQTDTLDVASHSMGYAYAVGMLREIKKANIKLGRFYIVAPENGCGGGIDWSIFREVWQYGSNLGEGDEDPPWDQDGVAPQCEVSAITNLPPTTHGGRVFIPKTWTPKGFLDCHTIANYGWIFTTIKYDPKKPNGYVRPRN